MKNFVANATSKKPIRYCHKKHRGSAASHDTQGKFNGLIKSTERAQGRG
jgi:hypothetical protein